MSSHLPGLSVVMIARDSSRFLDECLRALAPVADEIVLVDTGSTDDTAAIAEAHGCRVFHYSWCDDFSKARNFAVEQARHRWLLSVDTDEILTTPNARLVLEQAMARAEVPAYLVWQDNVFDSGEVAPNPVARLFQNDPRIRFRNPVHECISENIRDHFPGNFLRPTDVHLRHLGYLSPSRDGKHERSFAILNRWVAEAPDSLFANFKLGNMLWEAGRSAEAIAPLARAFAQLRDARTRSATPYLKKFFYVYYQALEAAGENDAAVALTAIAQQWQVES